MHGTRWKSCASLLLASWVMGCATGRPVGGSHRPDPGSAYIYGRFRVAGDTTLNLSGPGVTFEIRCRDGKTYDINFNRGTGLQLISLKPSICQIEDIVADDGKARSPLFFAARPATKDEPAVAVGGLIGYAVYGDQTPRHMSGFRLLQNEELQPGGVYYVGDFLLTAKDNRSASDRHYNWIYKIRNNYMETTDAMKRTHPPFASVATENRMSR